jgi:hypothetical protein
MNTNIARPSKISQIGIFGVKIYHLATLRPHFAAFDFEISQVEQSKLN